MDEADPQYEEFHRKWSGRLGLKGQHIALGYLRGQALDVDDSTGLEPEDHEIAVHVRVDGRGVDFAVDPTGIDALVEEWRSELEAQTVQDQRKFTKDFITQTVALNRHLDDKYGPIMLCSVMWLASQYPKSLESLRGGDCALLCEFSFDDATKQRRLQMSVLYGSGDLA